MSVKLSGAEWKKFLNDPKVWKVGMYYEGEIMEVNGEVVDDFVDDFDPTTVADSDVVKISEGILYQHEDDRVGVLFVAVVRQWLKRGKWFLVCDVTSLNVFTSWLDHWLARNLYWIPKEKP